MRRRRPRRCACRSRRPSRCPPTPAPRSLAAAAAAARTAACPPPVAAAGRAAPAPGRRRSGAGPHARAGRPARGHVADRRLQHAAPRLPRMQVCSQAGLFASKAAREIDMHCSHSWDCMVNTEHARMPLTSRMTSEGVAGCCCCSSSCALAPVLPPCSSDSTGCKMVPSTPPLALPAAAAGAGGLACPARGLWAAVRPVGCTKESVLEPPLVTGESSHTPSAHSCTQAVQCIFTQTPRGKQYTMQ